MVRVSRTRDAALLYAKRGWHVFPIWPAVDGLAGRECSCPKGPECKRPAKHPMGSLVPNGHDDATTDVATIKAWWLARPDANVGISLEPSRLTVLDVDVSGKHKGAESLAALEAEGALPDTLTARTGSGGLHAVYQRPTDVDAGRKIAFRPGLDLLGKGYIVAAPSNHVSGGAYEWIDGAEIVALPEFLRSVYAQVEVASIRDSRMPNDAPSDFGPASPDVLAEVQRFLANHGPAKQGEGGDQHTYRACAIAVNDFALTEREALSVLSIWDAGNEPPWLEAGLLEKMSNSERYAQNERGGARRAHQEQREFVQAVVKGKSDADEDAPPASPWVQLLAVAKAKIVAVLANTPADGTPAPLFRASTTLLAEPDVATPWRVQGFMTKGGTAMLAGGPKSSKTWMELEVCIACATGTKAFDQFDVPEAIDVALFLAEDDATAYKTRMRALVAGRPGGLTVEESTARIYVQPRGRSLDLLKVDDLALIVASCWATGKDFKLVSFDPLRDIHSGEEDKSDAMSVVMRHSRAVGEVLGAGVLLVHHMGKPSESGSKRSGGQKMRGSGAIHGSVDSGIYIHETKGNGVTKFASRVESQVKHGRSAGFFDLTLTIEDDADGKATRAVWKYTKGKSEEKPEEDAKKLVDADLESRVLAALSGGLWAYPISKLASILEMRTQPISAALVRLEERGLVHQALYTEDEGPTRRLITSESKRPWKLGASKE